MKVIILSGGSGTRLFPLSREKFPKQFLNIFDGKSLLQKTVERALEISSSVRDLVFLSNKEYLYHIKNQVKSLLNIQPEHIVLEPSKRNTAPAIALGIVYMVDHSMVDEDEAVLVLPSDHILSPVSKFKEIVKSASEIAKEGYIVTFGIKPTRPETGYGYIEADESFSIHSGYKVKKFHEKPSSDQALEYISKHNFFWNSGMFCFTPKTFMEELKTHSEDIYSLIDGKRYTEIIESFDSMPDISIDYAIMEKTSKAAVIPTDIYWSDVGSFDSIYDVLEKDQQANAVSGEFIGIDSKNNLVITTGKPVATVGVEDVIIVNTDDITVVIKKGESQKVRQLHSIIKQSKKDLTEVHLTDYRPWGSFTLLDCGDRFKIKRITVNPGESLSLQMHYHRSEHWVVVKGTALVVYEDENGDLRDRFVRENESIFIPKTTKHRLINPGKIPLELIEVQVGEYVGEDDIIRFDDKYKR